MAKKKTSKRKSKKGSKLQALRPNFSDDRFRTIAGIVFLLSALYLFVALSSYIFTWEKDQASVFRFSWKVLFQPDLIMQNRLGRLGAFISHSLIYWGFGGASFIFVYTLLFEGLKRLTFNTWSRLKAWRNTVLVICLLPVILSAVLNQDSFPWGGSYGYAISYWLRNFLGTIGLYTLLLAIVSMVVVWLYNPKITNIRKPSFKLFNIKFPELKFRSIKLPEWLQWSTANAPSFASSGGNTSRSDVNTLKVERESQISDTMEADNQFDFLQDPPKLQKARKANPNIQPELELETTPVEPAEEETEMLEENMRLEKLRVEAENDTDLDPYDPKLELRNYQIPPIELLEEYADSKIEVDRRELEANKDQIIETLLNYKIQIIKIRATVGPTVTLYEIVPAPGVRISKIKNLEDDIALSLAALGIRIIAPIPGRGTIGIEVPNKQQQIVSLREIIKSDKFKNAKMDLPIALGKTISNEVFVADLAKMPHLLVAGATGQGKSVGINSILISLLYKKHPS